MAEQEEVTMEVEALEAMYADDCTVINIFPPHLHLHIKPRTADVHSQQFVEATIELRAGLEYPSDPPYLDIIGSKGLNETRQKHLTTSLHEKACEVAPSLMLVALCEEAVEVLSYLKHPEGDCPLCLYPLVPEEKHSKTKSFMKLMSCFHCFHCECIIRWLKWIHEQNGANCGTSSVLSSPDEENLRASDLRAMMGGNTGNCPVCRKGFLAKDIEHVLNLDDSYALDTDVDEEVLSEKLLQCDLEISRRRKFEAIMESQLQRGGLIEPPKANVLFSRICIQDLVREATLTEEETVKQQHRDQVVGDEPESSGSSKQTCGSMKERQSSCSVPTEPASSGSQPRHHTGPHRHSGSRKHGRYNSRPQAKQWTKKE